MKYEADSFEKGIFSQLVLFVPALSGKKRVSWYRSSFRRSQTNYRSDDELLNESDDYDLYTKFPHVLSYGQTKVPQRHVNVSLINDCLMKQTNYWGLYELDSADYLRMSFYVENFEYQLEIRTAKCFIWFF